jgi:hypothetical protein
MPDIPCADVAASCGDAWSMGVQVCRPFRLHAYRLFRVGISFDSHHLYNMGDNIVDIRGMATTFIASSDCDLYSNHV